MSASQQLPFASALKAAYGSTGGFLGISSHPFWRSRSTPEDCASRAGQDTTLDLSITKSFHAARALACFFAAIGARQ